MSQATPVILAESSVPSILSPTVRRLPLIERPAQLRYGVAFLSISLTFFAEKFALPWIALHAPLTPLLALILALAFYAGAGPSLMATVLGAVYMQVFLFMPASLGGDATKVDNTRLLFFVLLGTLASWLSDQWRRSNATLRDREQKLRILLDKMPVVLWSTDVELRLTSSSAAMAYLFPSPGLATGENGKMDEDLFRHAASDSLPAMAQRRAVAGEAVSYDMESAGRFFHVHVEPLLGPGGAITGSFGMALDVTAQQRAEMLVRHSNQDLEVRVASRTEELANANIVLMNQIAERKRAERELRDVTEHARCILWHAGIEHDPTVQRQQEGLAPLRWEMRLHDDAATQQILPLLAPEGMNLCAVFFASRHPEDAEAMNRLSDRAILGGESGYTQEFRCIDRHGQLHWMYETVSLQARGPGHWTAVGVITDVTARKIAEMQRDAEREQVISERTARAEAEAANKAKDHFLATLSHELRTPMTPVLMTVSSMENDSTLSEETRASLRMIRRNVELEARLIDDLLDLTRISRGKLEMRALTTDVHSLLCHARDVCLPDAELRRQTIELDTAAQRCFVRGDATRLQQVFWNLLRNAIKFTPEGGTIRLRSRNDDAGKLVITVTDTGIGIDPRLLPRIFDAFEQGGSETTRRFGGLGLGLAISKAVIDLHGGTLRADSEGHGRGSTFTVILQTIDAPAPVITNEAPAAGESQPLRILLVEDHPDTRKATARLLRMLGHEVATADGVATGLQAAGSASFDLVISDLGLPDGSGLDLMRQIKQRFGFKGIALSGFGMDTDLLNSTDAGFDCHLVKPVPLEQLEAAIRRVSGLEVEQNLLTHRPEKPFADVAS